jgi:fido (protein-threonine AMPylation protein)
VGQPPPKTENDGRRHSQPLNADLIEDANERARQEARNALRQFDEGVQLVRSFLEPEPREFRLRMSHILGLHRVALEGISAYAGNFRPAGIKIQGSKHIPPDAHQVPEFVEEMCDYVIENWHDKSAIHLSAYVMWRLNWIHPFADGNGRTSRILSYVVLSLRLGMTIPGTRTIPDQITDDRKPYFDALDEADAHWMKSNSVDVALMEKLIEEMLATQFLSVIEQASNA